MTEKNKTHWHRLLGTLLEQLLTPVGITVQCDVKVMTNPPEADILLLRRSTQHWTNAQRKRLPDGIRDSLASSILLEFKYTESLNEKALKQTLSYDFFYKRANHLSDKQVQSFLISAKTPHSKTLKKFSYQLSEHSGIYYSKMPLLETIDLIILNELSDEAHNVWLKCFASRRLEKKKAFTALKTMGDNLISLNLKWFLSGLCKHWFNDTGEFDMSTELTPEKVMEMGKFWGESYLSLLNPEERLQGLGVKERLQGLGVKERLQGLGVKERLQGLGVKERLQGLNTKEILKGLDTKEVLSMIDHQKIVAELNTKERLANLPIEEIENYLQQLKK